MSHQYQPPGKSASCVAARRKTFAPFCWMYCRIQIQTPRAWSCTTTWSQQKPPAADGRVVNGSTNVQLAPPSVERLAYQLPVTNRLCPAAPTEGSPTVDVLLLVAASSRVRLSVRVTLVI